MTASHTLHIAVLGAGAWGTAIAISAARQQHQVSLWTRQSVHAQAMQTQRCNQRYLPEVPLPATIQIHAGMAHCADVASCDLVIIACPVAGLREQLLALRGCRTPVVWLCKGFEALQPEQAFGLLPHEVLAQTAPDLQAGVLSGPSFALEVAREQPTALVVASPHSTLCEAVTRALHGPALRIYSSQDYVGVEVGGAVKNVLAIATGVLDGLARKHHDAAPAHQQSVTGTTPGLNARAALLTRGLAEMTRLGVALGADPATFMGLSGMGDLVLTATGDLSRNRKVGLLLAQGLSVEAAVHSLGHVAEGVYCARTVLARAQHLGIDMPVTQCVVGLLDGTLQPQEAMLALMQRQAKAETGAFLSSAAMNCH